MTGERSPRRVRRHAGLLALLLFALVPGAAGADQIAIGTEFCDGQAMGVVGEGSVTQVNVQVGILQPAFNRACRKEAGLVTYLGTTEQRAVQGLVDRERAFTARDVPLSPLEKATIETSRFWTSPVHQIPIYVNGWAMAYNIPCSGGRLQLSAQNLSSMYLGLINTWSDPRLVADNAWLAACTVPVLLARRAEQAGATRVLQDYLSKVNPVWSAFARGVAPSSWPNNDFDCNGHGEIGMVNCVNNLPGSIGYVEIAVAVENQVPVALMQNATASFVAPDPAGCTNAAAAAVTPPGTSPVPLAGGSRTPWLPATLGDWSAVSITNAPDVPGSGASYPICSFSYVFVLQIWSNGYNSTTPGLQTRTTVDFLTVALRDATQRLINKAGYAELPDRIRQISRDGVASVSYFYLTTFPGI